MGGSTITQSPLTMEVVVVLELLFLSGASISITAKAGGGTLTITGYKVHVFTTTGASTFVVSSDCG